MEGKYYDNNFEFLVYSQALQNKVMESTYTVPICSHLRRLHFYVIMIFENWKVTQKYPSVLRYFENSRLSFCHELDKIKTCFINKTNQYIDLKLSLKIYLTGVLNILKEQLFGALRLRFSSLMTLHENQQHLELNSTTAFVRVLLIRTGSHSCFTDFRTKNTAS